MKRKTSTDAKLRRMKAGTHQMKAFSDIDEAKEMIMKAKGTAPSYYCLLPRKERR